MKTIVVAVALGLVAGCASTLDRTPSAASGGTAAPSAERQSFPGPGPSPCWENSLCSRP